MHHVRGLLKFGRVVIERFLSDRCLTRSSGLAYSSLLALVPLLAVMFSVLKGLGVQRRLEPLLLSRLPLQPETTQFIIGYIDRTNVGTLGALGAVLLLVTIIGLMRSIEGSFNDIWRVRESRTRWRQITDFLGVILLTPFLLLAATAITSSLQSQRIVRFLLDNEVIGSAMVESLRLLPVLFNILGLGVLYAVVPNRRPNWRALMIGAVIAGITWHLLQVTYVRFQIGVANYSAIYGALSQLPVLLAWLYVSWVVVLTGAQIAAVYELGVDTSQRLPSSFEPRAVALHLLLRCADAFDAGSAAPSTRLIARELQLPFDAVDRLAAEMAGWGWLAVGPDDPTQFRLARAPQTIELHELARLPRSMSVPSGCDQRAARTLAEQTRRADEGWRELTLADVISADAPSAT